MIITILVTINVYTTNACLLPTLPSQAKVETRTYQWHKDQDKNNSGADPKPSAEQGSKSIDELIQCVCGHKSHSQHHTGDVDGSCYVFGVIKALDFDLADGEGQKKTNDLQQHLVSIEQPQKDAPASGVTNVSRVFSYDSKCLNSKENGMIRSFMEVSRFLKVRNSRTIREWLTQSLIITTYYGVPLRMQTVALYLRFA